MSRMCTGQLSVAAAPLARNPLAIQGISESPVASSAASTLLRGDGAGEWVEETDTTIDANGSIRMAGGFLLIGDNSLNGVSLTITGGGLTFTGIGTGQNLVRFITPVDFEETVYLDERGLAAADKPGFGQLWVRNTTPQALMFTDEASVDNVLVYAADLESLNPKNSDRWNFNTNIAFGDPGLNSFEFNSATPASVTVIYWNDTALSGIDAGGLISGVIIGDLIYIYDTSDWSSLLTYRRTGALTDYTGFWGINVTHVSGTTLPSSGQQMVVSFEPPALPSTSVDNSTIRWNATDDLWESTGSRFRIDSSVLAETKLITSDSNLILDAAAQVRIGSAGTVFYGQYTSNVSYIAMVNDFGGTEKGITTGSSGGNLNIEAGNGSADVVITNLQTAGRITAASGAEFRIGEQAAAPTAVATYGYLWVRNDTPNTLMFTDDGGNDKRISPIGTLNDIQYAAPTSAFTLSDATGVQSAMPAAIDTFALEANSTYEFEGVYLIASGTTAHTVAMAFAITTAVVTDINYVTDAWNSAANAIASAGSRKHTNSVSSTVVTASTTNVRQHIRFKGIIRVTTGGTVVPQIAFSAAPGGTNQMLVGSHIKFTRIGSDTEQTTGGWA